MKTKRNKYERSFDPASDRPIGRSAANKVLVEIWREYERRLKSSWHSEPFDRTKNDAAKYFLRREVYTLGLYISRCPPVVWSTGELISKIRPGANRPEKHGEIFHDLLMSVYEDDQQIDRRERWQAAQELEYARRHGVPPELLCGFLLQSGPKSEISKKVKSDYVEPAFRVSIEDD